MPDDASKAPNKSLRAHHACEQGDLAALLDGLDHPADFPNCRDLPALGEGFLLAYLIYWSPLPFIDTVIRLGADPNYPADDGFPAVIAALSSERPEKYAVVQLLLDRGAHVNARGINDWTPLHWAVAHRDVRASRVDEAVFVMRILLGRRA